jgi:hypothetical protein
VAHPMSLGDDRETRPHSWVGYFNAPRRHCVTPDSLSLKYMQLSHMPLLVELDGDTSGFW